MSRLYAGSFVALVTPMRDDGAIDWHALESLIEWHIHAGSNGLVIMGTTGESSLVSADEHVEIVERALAYSQGRIKVIAGCGSASTSGSLELVKRLNSLKLDGFLCVTPYYVKPTQAGLKLHFRAIADECDAPLILYNVPARTGCDLKDSTAIELATHDNIAGIKDATGDISRLKTMQAELGDSDFCFLSGDDASAFNYIANGGHGVITVTGNLVPALMSRWCSNLMSADAEANESARRTFSTLKWLNEALFVEANPIPVKWALAELGKISNGIRLPLTWASSESQRIVADALKRVEL